jgi:acetylcholinesterase
MHDSSTTLYAKYSSPVRWPFQPVVDYAYVKQAPSVSWAKGQFERVPILTGFNTDEGTGFVPRSVQNATQFRQYFQTLLIANDTILNKIEQLYPDPATNPGSPYRNSSFSPQWSRLAAAYGDYAYISTVRGSALAIAGARDKKAPVWKYHFNRITTST